LTDGLLPLLFLEFAAQLFLSNNSYKRFFVILAFGKSHSQGRRPEYQHKKCLKHALIKAGPN
jgi:hypothetical protein